LLDSSTPHRDDHSVAKEPRHIEGAAFDLLRCLAPMQRAEDIPDLFAGLAHAIRFALGADAVFVSLLDEREDKLSDVAASVSDRVTTNLVVEEYRLDDYPATRRVLATGESLEVSRNDASADPREASFLEELGFDRVLITRISMEGEAVGAVEVYRAEDRDFEAEDPGEVEMLCAFATNAYARIQMASRLESHYTETMEALVSALEARDPYTEAHAGRIRDSAMALAAALKVPPPQRHAVKLGAILHDVGKIGISDSILLKPDALTDWEWEIMRDHPLIGERMLKSIEFLSPALPIVRHHHERWDGKGYPDGLSGQDIPIGARIVAVCDTFDAMTSERPYRKALSQEVACQEILLHAGRQFDPECAALLVGMVTETGEEENLEERVVRYAS
jgi:HD-GYP domain-containing protein (c-di-GMP phosphodiesterase class II)